MDFTNLFQVKKQVEGKIKIILPADMKIKPVTNTPCEKLITVVSLYLSLSLILI